MVAAPRIAARFQNSTSARMTARAHNAQRSPGRHRRCTHCEAIHAPSIRRASTEVLLCRLPNGGLGLSAVRVLSLQ